jgi:hypothetical protein
MHPPIQFMIPKPIIWTPNAVYSMELATDLPVPVISAETRANRDREAGADVVPVSLSMVDGHDQFREHDVSLRRDSSARRDY